MASPGVGGGLVSDSSHLDYEQQSPLPGFSVHFEESELQSLYCYRKFFIDWAISHLLIKTVCSICQELYSVNEQIVSALGTAEHISLWQLINLASLPWKQSIRNSQQVSAVELQSSFV